MTTKPLSLEYLIRPSNLSGKAPLILMLHGYGSDERDLFSFAPELPEKYIVVSARAPYPLGYGNCWYEINFDEYNDKFNNIDQAIGSRKEIEMFLNELIANYPIDATKITFLGFSQGSILSYAVALSHPEKVKQIIALSGYVDESMLVETYHQNDFSKLRIFSSHGISDQVIPIQWARKTQLFLEKLQIKHTYKEYPIGHGVSPQNFQDLKKWLGEG
ncbi:MAG TPA: alpha/beta hydrolase-fold protein [Flavobacteriaceae bacterium]|nr:alpha/beta hydrolase-fold protein [Flavobacteriaceae bacterium]